MLLELDKSQQDIEADWELKLYLSFVVKPYFVWGRSGGDLTWSNLFSFYHHTGLQKSVTWQLDSWLFSENIHFWNSQH